MWAKFSSALKQRPGTPAPGPDNDDDDDRPTSPSHADVLAGVFEQHPNLSVFHEPSEVPFPSPSPPASPSKHGRRGMFKRSKVANQDGSEPAPPPPPKLSLTLPKKVKSSLMTLSTGSDLSLNRNSAGSSTHSGAPRPSQDSMRSNVDDGMAPITPTTTETRYGSLRSILRDRHTPATGQSVRFFSRDAYKVISPDTTAASSSEADEMSFAARLQRSTPMRPRPSAQGLFSTPLDGPQTDSSNIFDLSQDAELPTIPAGATPLLDSAVEIPEGDTDATATTHPGEQTEQDRPGTPPQGKPGHDRSHSFSFGQTVFSLAGGGDPGKDAPGSLVSRAKANRSRALSDTVFNAPATPVRPEADIDDVSAPLVYAAGSPEREKDPFGAHATAYYTPGTVPPTPPPSIPSHTRTASREEDMIWSLRTQLALQSELCVQFEVDLGARDELVRALGARLEEAQHEAERRKGAVRGWRKRVGELERCLHQLQDEVERSREESAERSVYDEASGEALRMLHRRIEALERERVEGERREQQAQEQQVEGEEQLRRAREELKRRDESERVLKAGIKAAKEEMEQMGETSQGQVADGESRAQGSEEAARAQAAWEEERARLLSENEALRHDKVAVQAQLVDAREEAVHKESEVGVLRAELEAQWKHTEDTGVKMQELERQRDELQTEVDALQDRITNMEEDWSQSENRKAELEGELQEVWTAKEEAERERAEFEDQLRAEHEHADDLTHALQEREDRLIALEREQQYARDTITRLEARIRQQEADATTLGERAAAREADAEAAQEELTRMKREHARTVNDQSRTLQEVVAREVEARAGHEAMVREKAEADVLLGTLRERVSALAEEAERLRRQVHALQQESADKEVQFTSLAKQRAQDKDDLRGLNIALDSKQQELELLKRRMGVRGTAGNTPAQLSKVAHRRESSIFSTPAPSSRPPSVLSDVESTAKARKIETPSTAMKSTSTLGKSVRTNGSIVAKRSLEGAMGPPPSVTRPGASTSTSATPTRIPSSSGSARAPAAGPSITPSSFKATATQRRTSTSITEPSRLRRTVASRESLVSPSESDEKEKENAAPSTKAVRRMSAMPA